MAEVKELEQRFRSLPKGTAESNKAFKEWRDAANAPQPEEAKPEKKSARKRR